MNAVKQWYDWMGRQVHTVYATPVLIFMFFIEATVFLVPVDPLLILYCLEHRQKVCIMLLSQQLLLLLVVFLAMALVSYFGKRSVTL